MAAPGPSISSLIEINGHDAYRCYSDAPVAGGWREMRNPINSARYWTHVSLRLSTWSLVELLRLNGLEEFLILGEWGVFAVVPEDVKTYEDLEWGLPIYDNDRLSGAPHDRIPRGTLVITMGFARSGILELLLPGKDGIVVNAYAPLRSGGKRLLQRLPARIHNDDIGGMAAVTIPLFHVLPSFQSEGGASNSSALVVTADRDPRSEAIGHVVVGSQVSLIQIVGTRGQLGRIQDGERGLWGGWISIFLCDGTPTLERRMDATENMKLAAERERYLKQCEAMQNEAIARGEDPDAISLPPNPLDESDESREDSVPKLLSTTEPPACSKSIVEMNVPQRATVSGGWRQVLDKAWHRPVYIQPLAGRLTWGVVEVIQSGGLDDLLLARQWELCAVDPLAAEDQNDKNWMCKVYGDHSVSGKPILWLPKGTLVIVQAFHSFSKVASLILPPSESGSEPWIGYVLYQKRDGRQVLRAFLPQANFDEGPTGSYPKDPGMVRQSELGFAEPPETNVLRGPYHVRPIGDDATIDVSIGQDIGSDVWTRLPRGFIVLEFAEILGIRARLREVDGGGWVSLVSFDGTPCFWKEPVRPAKIEIPAEALDAEDATLPIVWPHFGVLRPDVEPPLIIKPETTLPSILHRIGGGRAICDWDREYLPLHGESYVWRNKLTSQSTNLHELMKHEIWKIAVVKIEDLSIRERPSLNARQMKTLPIGALVVTEWISVNGKARILSPKEPMDNLPDHPWASLAAPGGGDHACAALAPFVAGADLWVEPRGGSLPLEEQGNVAEHDFRRVEVRERMEVDSPSCGYLKRGDGVQIAEIHGRFARIIHTKWIEKYDTAPMGGWLALFDECGWCQFRVRFPGTVHPVDAHNKYMEQLRIDFAPGGKFAKTVDTDSEPDDVAKPVQTKTVESYAQDDMLTESSESDLNLPALLWQMGEYENKSKWTRDWRECVEPVWGQRYFVNKWSGQVVHSLRDFGVACPAVRLTTWFSNLSFQGIVEDSIDEESARKRIEAIRRCMVLPVAAMADVDDDRVELALFDGSTDDLGETQDSIVGRRSSDGFRVVAVIRAPGTLASWASGALKRAMSNVAAFSGSMAALIGSMPDFLTMRIDPYGDVSLLKADLEELDIPRFARMFEPPDPPPPPPPLPVQDEFAEIRRSYQWTRQSILHFHQKPLGLGDNQALSDGLESALPDSPLEEIGMWGCNMGDEGAFCLAKSLDAGCGANLLTLMLDENGISSAGAKALSVGLETCYKLRELGVSKNPIGAGFASLLSGLGSSLVILDASEAAVDDAGARAAAVAIERMSALRCLRLFGNALIGPLGCEAIARALLRVPSLKMADLRGASDEGEWPRLKRVLQDGGAEPERMRIR